MIKGLVNRREAEIKLFLTPVTADMHVMTEKEKTESSLAAIFHAIVAMFQGIKK